jgi:hypothetical protein
LATTKLTRYSALANMSDLPDINDIEDIRDIRFMHTEIRAGDRLLIKSTCISCGMAMLLSAADGSLQKWERWHVCDTVLPIGH